DAVVIGSGALGLSAAYHLAQLGLRDVVVLDRVGIASQTSARAAGLFKVLQTDELRVRLAALSIAKVTSFEEATGVPLPIQRSGSIMLAHMPAYAALVRAKAARAQSLGVEVEIIDGSEAHRLAPYLDAETIRAACHSPGDFYIEEPGTLLQALIQAGTRLGVSYHGHTPVTGLRVDAGEVTGVATTQGEIATPVVVDAAGAWARAVGALALADVSVAPVRHQLAITEEISGVAPSFPILRIIDEAVYVRPARGGLMYGGFEQDPLALYPHARDGFSIEDTPLDTAVLRRFAASVAAQVPGVDQAPLQEYRGGLFTMSPDGQFLVGPLPEARGLWCLTGCNGSGFSLSPALGQLLAEWITAGAPSIDIGSFHPGRFGGKWTDETRLRDVGIWQYTHYYDLDAQHSQ
ncbi:MAG: putative dehydrogenase protein, partial [Chloroflexi bacterium]|nr:putative dehydrogenase protein [Chloroflexota bacterium]